MNTDTRDRMIARMSGQYRYNPSVLFETAKDFHGGIHGDFVHPNGMREVDIEFPTVTDAVKFSLYVNRYVASVDIRHGDTISSLTQTVVLTVLTVGRDSDG